MKSFEAYINENDRIVVNKNNSTIIELSSKNSEGFDFIREYYREHQELFPYQFAAIEKMIGATNRQNIIGYEERIVDQSIRCTYGVMDAMPDCDLQGLFHPERNILCPLRKYCKHNGYNPETPIEDAICNPYMDFGFTQTEREVCRMLINLPNTEEQIAEMIHRDKETIRKHRHNILNKVGVSSRDELRCKLYGKNF